MKKTQALTIAVHVIGWLLFLCIPVFFLSQNSHDDYPGISAKVFLFCTYYICFFYLNTSWLIPNYYLRKKQLIYFTVVAMLFLATAVMQPFDRLIASGGRNSSTGEEMRPPPGMTGAGRWPHPERIDRPHERPPGRGRMMIDIVSIILFMLVWAVGFSLRLVTLYKNTETRALQAEAEKARAELSFLKARINPHFLFNTLNNIYSMAMIQHDQTAESVMRLSRIMRYITDDVDNDFVSLENEISCIENYIALQRLRLNKNTPVEYSCTGLVTGKQIAPLIFMPLIENVFKYGVSNHHFSPVKISLEIDDKSIHFYTNNRIARMNTDPDRSGIGLSNTRQRLQLLYPDRHSFIIQPSAESFAVDLIINFNDKP